MAELMVVDVRGRRVAVAGRGRLVRLGVVPGQRPAPPAASDVRVWVVADLLRRVLESMHGRQVVTEVSGPVDLDEEALRAQLEPLSVPPPEMSAAHSRPDLLISASTAVDGDAPLLHVAPVHDGRVVCGDPAALRLALLSVHHAVAIRLDGGVLGDAAVTIEEWRRLVRDGARSPSAAPVSPVLVRIAAALADNLDGPRVLAELRQLASNPALSAGARFETMLAVDRVLALDLPAGMARG